MRRTKPKKLYRQPDPRYKDVLVTRFVNNLMMHGKKSVAYKIFYDAMDMVTEKSEESQGYDVWKKALVNISPAVEVRSRRVGGSTFQIPTEIRDDRKTALGISWMISFARKRGGKSMAEKLAAEVLAASKGEGNAIKRKEDTHRMAEANKAFSHFRV